jgi:2-polyprenyl-3-methyl-5-hydroxy-6-metoxy-1,4-benzoquinol methylase
MKLHILKTVYAAYAFASRLDQIRPAIRYVLASFSGIHALIPPHGHLLDVGCGDGLLALYLRKVKHRTQRIMGVDIDQRKIDIAKQLDLPEVEFHHKDVANLPSHTFDIVTVVHVLYLIPIELREHFIAHCVRVLKPGGTLVLMLNIDTPRWKYYFTHGQELLMVKLFGLTKGETVQFQSLDQCQTWVAKAGALVCKSKMLGRGRPYSHAAVVAEKLPFAKSPAEDAMMVRKRDGTIQYWSEASQKLYGWEPHVALGVISHRLLKTVFPAPLDVIEAELGSKGYWDGQLIHERRDGSKVAVASHWELQQHPSSEDHSFRVIEINSRPQVQAS